MPAGEPRGAEGARAATCTTTSIERRPRGAPSARARTATATAAVDRRRHATAAVARQRLGPHPRPARATTATTSPVAVGPGRSPAPVATVTVAVVDWPSNRVACVDVERRRRSPPAAGASDPHAAAPRNGTASTSEVGPLRPTIATTSATSGDADGPQVGAASGATRRRRTARGHAPAAGRTVGGVGTRRQHVGDDRRAVDVVQPQLGLAP